MVQEAVVSWKAASWKLWASLLYREYSCGLLPLPKPLVWGIRHRTANTSLFSECLHGQLLVHPWWGSWGAQHSPLRSMSPATESSDHTGLKGCRHWSSFVGGPVPPEHRSEMMSVSTGSVRVACWTLVIMMASVSICATVNVVLDVGIIIVLFVRAKLVWERVTRQVIRRVVFPFEFYRGWKTLVLGGCSRCVLEPPLVPPSCAWEIPCRKILNWKHPQCIETASRSSWS